MFEKTVNVGAKSALALLKNTKFINNFYLVGGTDLSL